ncbi:hypothetical protein [Rubrolithibacter danxiaensis]|uniref:hypothetical protein n=1 Tax=Rubrolithibacter danxiaensis TaxID=3390805 RepID=UPI003BF84785
MQLEDLLNQAGEEGQPPKKESPLKSLEADLKFYNESIKEVAVEIIAEGISSYPVFVAHQHEVNLGEVILDKNDLNTEWTIQASTLEEFVEKGIVHPDKKERFIKHYKNPHEFMCLFVVVPEGANFVFYPY